ncbi:MAG TPA: hypothetical protein VGO00_02990 [Kofleriaceae bacterium]|jgi:hypothetical protein|nr:hypothetical protein [Kofleriaceae bacterium]
MTTVDTNVLSNVCGGFPNGIPLTKKPQPTTWTEQLGQSLLRRGYDLNIDPNGERRPPSSQLAPGIHKQWDQYAAPKTQRSS